MTTLPPVSAPAIPFAAVGPSGLPLPAIQTYSASGGAASIAGTIPAVPNQTCYLVGFDVTAAGANNGSGVLVTVTGLAGGSASAAGTGVYVFFAPTGGSVGATPLSRTFNPPLPAFAPNTAITVTVPSLGTGNLNAAVSVYGFSQ